MMFPHGLNELPVVVYKLKAECVLALEIEVERALGNAGSTQDLLKAGMIEALGVDETRPFPEDALL